MYVILPLLCKYTYITEVKCIFTSIVSWMSLLLFFCCNGQRAWIMDLEVKICSLFFDNIFYILLAYGPTSTYILLSLKIAVWYALHGYTPTYVFKLNFPAYKTEYVIRVSEYFNEASTTIFLLCCSILLKLFCKLRDTNWSQVNKY